MRTSLLTVCFLIVAISHGHAASLYKWVDKDGRVHYGEKPAEDAVQTEQKKFAAPSAAGDDELPYSVRKARQDFPVTLYVAASCKDICAQARSLLNKRGVPFVEKNLSTKEDMEAYKKLTGGNSVPVLTVGKTLLSGFAAAKWNSELDTAGYPETAPFGSRPPVASKPDASGAGAK